MPAGTLTPIVSNPDEAVMSEQVCPVSLIFLLSWLSWGGVITTLATPNPMLPTLLPHAQMRNVVRNVAQMFPTAIISGRGREKVESFVGLSELFYAGSHGMDIRGPDTSSGKVRHCTLYRHAAGTCLPEGEGGRGTCSVLRAPCVSKSAFFVVAPAISHPVTCIHVRFTSLS